MMKQRNIFIILLTVLLLYWGCQTSEESGGTEVLNPAIQAISPTSRARHLPWFSLTVGGENFREGAEIIFNDIRKTAEFIDSNTLRCTIDPIDLASATSGAAPGTSAAADNVIANIPVVVVNHASGAGESGRSNTVTFSLLEHPRFNDAVNISQTSGHAEFPMIVSEESGILHVIWVDNSDGQGAVFYRRSPDRGDTWEDARKLTPEGIVVCCPELAADRDGNVYIVFNGNGGSNDVQAVFFLRSQDHGLNWAWYTMLSIPGQPSYIPDIDVNDYGGVAVVWFEFVKERRSDIFLTRSSDRGESWSAPLNISDNIGHSDSPTVKVDGQGNIYAVWKDNRPGDWDVFFRRGLNYGTQWDETLNLSNDAIDSVRPVMACDFYGHIYVSWFDLGALDREIFFTSSLDGGKNWTATDTVSNDSTLSSEPAIALDEIGNVNLVWTNYGQGTNRHEIIFSRGIYGGGPWSPATTITGEGVLLPNYPDIATDLNGNIYLVWQQWLDYTHSQIMFAHSR